LDKENNEKRYKAVVRRAIPAIEHKKMVTSWIVREIQIQIATGYKFTFVMKAKIQKREQ
jgi:hypothetical protein